MTLQHDYHIIHEGAAIGGIADRRQLAVTGNDRASYLQGLLTNDIVALTAGSGCYSAWLSPQGRMLTDMHVLESGQMMLLDLPAETAQATLDRLEQFIFTEDVQVASLADSLTGVWMHGPGAAVVLERALEGAQGLGGWADYHHAPLSFRGGQVSVVRIDQLGVPGYCVYVEQARAPELLAALQASGAAPVGSGAIDAARVEAGYPLFGVDMTDEIIPLEAGIESRAISFTKGCYVGQEIVIRVLHRGHGRVAKKLVPLAFAGALPAPGTKLHAGEKEVGYVTSAADSPRSGAIGLGYVHRDFTAPGTVLKEATVEGGSGFSRTDPRRAS
jgi:folate-binding protein YgfZ